MTLSPDRMIKCASCERMTMHYREEVGTAWIARRAAWCLLLPGLLFGACDQSAEPPVRMGIVIFGACAAVWFFVSMEFTQATARRMPLACSVCGRSVPPPQASQAWVTAPTPDEVER